MPAFDYAAFLTNYAPATSNLFGGGDNITAVGRGPAVKAYPGGYNSSSDSVPITYTADGVPGARAMQVLMWMGGQALTGTGFTVVIEEQLSTLPTAPPTYPPAAPTASGIYRPLGIANFGDSPASSGTWNVSGSWTADPLATTTVAGVSVAGLAGTGSSGNGTGSSGSNGRLYTQLIVQVDPNVYSINYNIIRYTGGGTMYGFNAVVIPFSGSGKDVGSPA